MQWLPELKFFQIEQEKSREENFDEFLEDLFMWLPFRCCEIEKKIMSKNAVPEHEIGLRSIHGLNGSFCSE